MESLKIPDAEPLYTQVFLCLRVLLTRVSPDHLQTVWPIVLMEIIRTFEESMDSALLLSACKFIDLAVILLPRYFHLYQWCFVRGKGDSSRNKHRLQDKPPGASVEVVATDGPEVSARDATRKFGGTDGLDLQGVSMVTIFSVCTHVVLATVHRFPLVFDTVSFH